MRNIWTLRNNLILRKTRSDRIPPDVIIHHNLYVVSYINKTGGGQERTKKLEISVAAVCTFFKHS